VLNVGQPTGHRLGASTTPHTHIVRVLDQHVPAVRLLVHQVDDHTHDTPTVVERDVHLSGKVARLVRLHADDDVTLGVLWVGPRDEAASIAKRGSVERRPLSL
jgi:hypothetical protein